MEDETDTGGPTAEDAVLESLIETSGPVDETDPDTGDVEDTEGLLVDPADQTEGLDEDDTGAPLRAAMKVAARVNPKKLSRRGLASAMAKSFGRGKRAAKKKRPIRGNPAPSHIVQARRQVARSFRAANPNSKLMVKKGFYYATMFLEFTVSGSATSAVAVLLKDKTISCFDKYVGDTVTFNGQTVTLTEAHTNLARKGATNYPNQRFMIERTTFADAGVIMFYDSTTVNASSQATAIKDALLGKNVIFDEDGLFVPKGLYHDQTGRNELFRSCAASSVLRFTATRTNVGSNRDFRDQLIDTMENMPVVGRGSPIGMTMTSGGGEWPYLEEGWVWNLDLNSDDAEVFATTMEVRNDVTFGFTPVKATGGSTADVPSKIVLLIRVRHEGTSYRKKSMKDATAR